MERDIAKITVTTKELADFWGISDRMVREYTEMGMPKSDRNMFYLKECNDWLREYKEKEFKRILTEDSDLEKERTRLTKVQADLKEVEYALEIKTAVRVDDVIKEFDLIIENVKNKIMSWPQKAAPKVFGCKSVPEVKVALKKSVNEALYELSRISLGSPSNTIPEGKDKPKSKAVRSSTGAKSKRMGKQ